MTSAEISVGLQIGTQPPLSATRTFVLAARAMRLDSMMVIARFQNVFPLFIGAPDRELTRCRLTVPAFQHDLAAELRGHRQAVLDAGPPRTLGANQLPVGDQEWDAWIR